MTEWSVLEQRGEYNSWLRKASSSWKYWLKILQQGLHHLDDMRPPHLTASLLGPERPYHGPQLPYAPLAKEQPCDKKGWAEQHLLQQRLAQAERRADEAEAREHLMQEKLLTVTHMCQRLQAIVHSPRPPECTEKVSGQLSRGLLTPPFRGTPHPLYLDLMRQDSCIQSQTLL